ncbi:hypothetical protein K443DRAFT_111033 [Laccaria amethystina LaAM-08-1]|uniref:Ferric oxidoreductase domain-containing protein n=1 Tax=Laccaria amethystina LaAM-08-1 TaxID=1095629 RepID=A0A0C9XD09_9AGAR|nr:hypothetical protein K443DRAFT_111033 [Laccaria amethystina LaAM-08-1]
MPLASTPPAQSLTQSSSADLRRARKQIQLAHVKQLWIFLASVIAFFTVLRVLRLILRIIVVSRPANRVELVVSEKEDLESTSSTTMRRINSPILRLYAAVATGFRIVAFRWSLPIGPGSVASISELTFIFVYIASMFLWLFLDTNNLDRTFYEGRAAFLACCQLPLIVALAGKNNIISWMTGIGHEKLNVLHRASSRVNFIFIWIHTIARLIQG